jgi:hypothetical protein
MNNLHKESQMDHHRCDLCTGGCAGITGDSSSHRRAIHFLIVPSVVGAEWLALGYSELSLG